MPIRVPPVHQAFSLPRLLPSQSPMYLFLWQSLLGGGGRERGGWGEKAGGRGGRRRRGKGAEKKGSVKVDGVGGP